MSRQKAAHLPSPADHVEDRLRQWAREFTDIDTRGMSILGRARWITLSVRPAIERVFTAYGLDAGEFDVLATLLRSGPPYRLRPTELFRSLMVSSGGLTNRLMRLERAGLIFRPSSEADGRSLPVQLTALGRERTEAAFREDMKVEAELLAGLSETEMKTLARLLAKLAASLPAAAAPAGDRASGGPQR